MQRVYGVHAFDIIMRNGLMLIAQRCVPIVRI